MAAWASAVRRGGPIKRRADTRRRTNSTHTQRNTTPHMTSHRLPWLPLCLLAAAAAAWPGAAAYRDAGHDLPLGVPDQEADEPGEPISAEEFEQAASAAAGNRGEETLFGESPLVQPPLDEGSPDPILAAGLFEGDIAGVSPGDVLANRNAIRDGSARRWEGGVVPYVISAAFTPSERLVVAAAFREVHELTCVRFVPRSTQPSYVYLRKGAGCSSQIGRVGGEQSVNLGAGCVYKGVVEHELMHVLGFWHEHSRADRDAYITVLLQNVIPGLEHNFQKYSWQMVQSLGLPYDTGSVMHYGRLAFSRDGRSPTIVPRDPRASIGQRRGFSEVDVAKINLLYGCGNWLVRPTSPPPRPAGCSDSSRFCKYWARTGECRRNPYWMRAQCALSCRFCGYADERGCADQNALCERWAQVGECARSQDYMEAFCPAACRAC